MAAPPETQSRLAVRSRVGLRAYLQARLAPLAVFLFATIAISAPVAYHLMGTATVRANAQSSARQVAVAIRDEAELRPRLWRYGAESILAYRRAHEAEPSIVQILLLDAAGRPIDVGGEYDDASRDDLLWGVAPVRINEDHVADVWVGATTEPVEKQALRLLFAFAGLGFLLAGLTYVLPSRAMVAAEGHIHALITRLEASQAALADLNADLEAQVVERSRQLANALAQLRSLSQRAASMQEAERRAISRELHDSAGQALTAVRLNLQFIEGMAPQVEPEKVAARAQQAIDVLDGALEEIRRVVHRLAPVVLDDVGLAAALRRQCEDAEDRSDVLVYPEIKVPSNVGSALEITCYRIVQESLTNITRHAEASEIHVRVGGDAKRLIIEIEDDGKGFDVDEALAKGRRGLRGMRERVELLAGSFELETAPGKGTRLRVELPRDDTPASASGVMT